MTITTSGHDIGHATRVGGARPQRRDAGAPRASATPGTTCNPRRIAHRRELLNLVRRIRHRLQLQTDTEERRGGSTLESSQCNAANPRARAVHGVAVHMRVRNVSTTGSQFSKRSLDVVPVVEEHHDMINLNRLRRIPATVRIAGPLQRDRYADDAPVVFPGAAIEPQGRSRLSHLLAHGVPDRLRPCLLPFPPRPYGCSLTARSNL
jgi:hypothetical protein